MKSILKDMELNEGKSTWTVQISEGGRVSLSFDGVEANIMLSTTVKELKEYHAVIAAALEARAEQVREELN